MPDWAIQAALAAVSPEVVLVLQDDLDVNVSGIEQECKAAGNWPDSLRLCREFWALRPAEFALLLSPIGRDAGENGLNGQARRLTPVQDRFGQLWR